MKIYEHAKTIGTAIVIIISGVYQYKYHEEDFKILEKEIKKCVSEINDIKLEIRSQHDRSLPHLPF